MDGCGGVERIGLHPSISGLDDSPPNDCDVSFHIIFEWQGLYSVDRNALGRSVTCRQSRTGGEHSIAVY